MNAQSNIVPADISQLSNAELRKLENRIARKYTRDTTWFAVVWAFGNLAFWLSLWPLVFTGVLPLWAAFPLAVLSIALVYIPTHEAQHDIVGRPGGKLRWLNELLGHATT